MNVSSTALSDADPFITRRTAAAGPAVPSSPYDARQIGELHPNKRCEFGPDRSESTTRNQTPAAGAPKPKPARAIANRCWPSRPVIVHPRWRVPRRSAFELPKPPFFLCTGSLSPGCLGTRSPGSASPNESQVSVSNGVTCPSAALLSTRPSAFAMSISPWFRSIVPPARRLSPLSRGRSVLPRPFHRHGPQTWPPSSRAPSDGRWRNGCLGPVHARTLLLASRSLSEAIAHPCALG